MTSENNQPIEKKRIGCAIGMMIAIIVLFEVAKFIGTFQFSEYAAEIDTGQYKQIFYPPAHEIVEMSDNTTFLWATENVETQPNGWWMEAADEKLFVPTNGLTVYNGQTGSTLWHSNTAPDRLQVAGNAVYIAAGNYSLSPYIEALDIETGTRLWDARTFVTSVKFIDYIRVHDDLVYILAPPDACRLYSATTGDLLFRDNKLSCMDSEEVGAEVPSSYDPKYYRSQSPISTDIWQFDELVSNEAIAKEIVFGLTENSKLEGRDMESGDVIYSIQFSPEKMHRVSWNGVPYKHKVAVDTANNLVYVWFVDSKQLFAFQFLGG